jgi:hypothetical protein
MKFAICDADLNLNNIDIIYLYDNSIDDWTVKKNHLMIGKMESQKNINTLAIDVIFFSYLLRVFKPSQLPAFVIFNNLDNFKTLTTNNYDDILKAFDIYKLGAKHDN